MLHVDITTCDIRLIASEVEKSDLWTATIFDMFSGKSKSINFTANELATILALMVAGEDYPHSESMYKIIADKLVEIPDEFRPVP